MTPKNTIFIGSDGYPVTDIIIGGNQLAIMVVPVDSTTKKYAYFSGNNKLQGIYNGDVLNFKDIDLFQYSGEPTEAIFIMLDSDGNVYYYDETQKTLHQFNALDVTNVGSFALFSNKNKLLKLLVTETTKNEIIIHEEVKKIISFGDYIDLILVDGKIRTIKRDPVFGLSFGDTTPPELTLLGDNPMSLNQYTPYSEPGYNVTDDSEPIFVEILGSVDHETIGNYYIVYRAHDPSGNETEISRTVNVIEIPDVTGPVITLNGDDPVDIMETSGPYVEEGGSVTDDYDPTVSWDDVVITYFDNLDNPIGGVDTDTEGTYRVHYSVFDSAGNEGTEDRIVNVTPYIDTVAPVITLAGNASMTKYQYDPWVDPGIASVTDNVTPSQDITVTITYELDDVPVGSIGTALGTYKVIYTAEDEAGNTSSISRIVNSIEDPADYGPHITLSSEDDIEIEEGDTLNLPTATASDNKDGNITGDIVLTNPVNNNTAGNYTVTWDVEDSDGYTDSKSITVTVTEPSDVVGPVITKNSGIINGWDYETIWKYEFDPNLYENSDDDYIDPGATAFDQGDFDDGINNGVCTVNATDNINHIAIGTYAITYTAQDSKANQTQVQRTITVVNPPAWSSGVQYPDGYVVQRYSNIYKARFSTQGDDPWTNNSTAGNNMSVPWKWCGYV